MRRDLPRKTALLLALALAAASPALAELSLEFDGGLDLRRFRTFARTAGTPAPNPQVDQLIATAIEGELRERGLARVDSRPMLRIATHALIEKHTLAELAEGTNWEFWTGVTGIKPTDVGVGTLVIDFLDGESGDRLCRALATGTVSDRPERAGKRVGKVVTKIFRKLPVAVP